MAQLYIKRNTKGQHLANNLHCKAFLGHCFVCYMQECCTNFHSFFSYRVLILWVLFYFIYLSIADSSKKKINFICLNSMIWFEEYMRKGFKATAFTENWEELHNTTYPPSFLMQESTIIKPVILIRNYSFLCIYYISSHNVFKCWKRRESKWEKDTSEMQKMFQSGRNIDLRSRGI